MHLQQGLSQQQLRFVRLLEMNAPELDEAIARELEDNPALEVKIDDASRQLTDDGREFGESPEQLQQADYSDPDEAPPLPLRRQTRADASSPLPVPPDSSESLYDYLMRQLPERNLQPDIRRAAEYLIGSLDSNGYLSRPLHAVASDLAINQGLDLSDQEMEQALDAVRSLDPAGVGATDLRDCLLLQLTRLPQSERRDDAINILTDHFEAFAMKHSHKIISGLRISRARLDAAFETILSLNPKPGSSVGSGAAGGEAPGIIPDFAIDVYDGKISITLNNNLPELSIASSFESAVKQIDINARVRRQKGNEFLTTRYTDAREFIRLIEQRQNTLFAVITAIAEVQRDYLLSQDPHRLHPLALKDIATRTGYDISVISRATNGKYVALPWGIFPLRFFFSKSFGEEGENVSGRNIEAAIKSAVAAEDKKHPLSDDAIHKILLSQGYTLSRRTVAKYRDRLGIPVGRLRRAL